MLLAGGVVAVALSQSRTPAGEPLPREFSLIRGKHFVTGSGLPGIDGFWYFDPGLPEPPEISVMIIHGAGRNAEDYLEAMMAAAEHENWFLIAPRFKREAFVFLNGGWEYLFNMGNVVHWFGWDREREQWYFTAVESLYRRIVAHHPRLPESYALFGHSAGGQFITRMVLFSPEASVDLAIAANAGWYTIPDFELAFPYGLAGAPVDEATLGRGFQKRLIIALGLEDRPHEGGFRTREPAMDQGRTRIERGRHFYERSRAMASSMGVPFSWHLQEEPDVGHDFREMAKRAAELLRQHYAGEPMKERDRPGTLPPASKSGVDGPTSIPVP